jgi:hypothetical protein
MMVMKYKKKQAMTVCANMGNKRSWMRRVPKKNELWHS